MRWPPKLFGTRRAYSECMRWQDETRKTRQFCQFLKMWTDLDGMTEILLVPRVPKELSFLVFSSSLLVANRPIRTRGLNAFKGKTEKAYDFAWRYIENTFYPWLKLKYVLSLTLKIEWACQRSVIFYNIWTDSLCCEEERWEYKCWLSTWNWWKRSVLCG